MTGHVEFNWDSAKVEQVIHDRLRVQMLQMADRVVQLAESFAPRKTGRLATSIGYDWNDAELTVVFTVGASYGIFQEYGTRNMPPHAYLRPAINQVGPIYGFNVEMAFLNTPEYSQPVLAVGNTFSIPKTLSHRQRARVKENRLKSEHYYHSQGNVHRARMHARRREF